MPAISIEDISKVTGTAKLPGVARLLMKLLNIDAFNLMMQQAGELDGPAFTNFALNYLGVTLNVNENELKHIPANGAFVVVANHPYGAIESLALLTLLVAKRADTLFMGNFLLKRVPNLAPYIIAVNPFEKVKDSSSISGIKTTLLKLKQGTPVAIFPAGEVSAFDLKSRSITDRQWHPVVGKLIAKANVPVLPIYFHGNNGFGFSLLRMLHPSLQTAMLPTELFNKEGKVLHVRIGKPLIPGVDLDPRPETSLHQLRTHTYAMGNRL
ncbi:1-acyl-sn-glycerol-3-phosphate acyltransferase [Mucilaginibacter sp. PAMB04274]|uniref:1-acyl-sn-glycerol-3-phosphate acyltransferase n=1 Tax=Mucilaginibacter sp. PAMB04274 TaxID=3138568 RepID=UPI0031F663AA